MNFMDVLVDCLQQEMEDPRRVREVLYFLVMDLALKSKKLTERKAWEILGSLIAIVAKTKSFPDFATIKGVSSKINSEHRERIPRTSESLFSLKWFELGEASVKEFLSSQAWKGLPGFGEENSLPGNVPGKVRNRDANF